MNFYDQYIGSVIAMLGNMALVGSAFFVLYSILALILAIRLKDDRVAISARRAIYGQFILLLIVFISLLVGFLGNDFSREFIFKNSNRTLSLLYKLAGPWGGLEGSLVLWSIILSLYTILVVKKYSVKHRQLTNHALIYLGVIQLFIISLLVFFSNPLRNQLPLEEDGQGLNPLLQHPGMIIHPPLLYLGFIGFSVPFAFALASLATNNFNSGWITLTRKWVMISWCFLTAGIAAGGMWAYEVLGWGGYWAWDPVENSSLMPWIIATAFIHTSLTQEKTKQFGMWNYFLIILTFVMTIVGTFITRSGILNSVHAFSKSNLGGYFLGFILIVIVYSLGLIILRLKSKSNLSFKSLFSREVFFLFGNLLFLALALSIFYGTIFPLISEGLVDRKISIAAPFFNKISWPIVSLLLLLMSATPFISWAKGDFKSFKKAIFIPLLIAIVAGIVAFFGLLADIKFAVFFACLLLAFMMTLKWLLRSLKKNAAISTKKSYKKYFARPRSMGAILVHLGILLTLVGVLGKYFSHDKSFTLSRDQTVEYGDYQIFFSHLEQIKDENLVKTAAVVQVLKNNVNLSYLYPAKAFYPTNNETITIIDTYRTAFSDLYLSLAEINNNDSITLTIYLNRLVLFIPLGLLFLIVGGLLNIFNSKSKKPVLAS